MIPHNIRSDSTPVIGRLRSFARWWLLSLFLIAFLPLNAHASISLAPSETLVLDASESIYVDGSVSLVSTSTMDASAGGSQIALSGDWANQGTFGSGDVIFQGPGTSIISGNSHFRSFTCQTGGKTLSFEAGSTQSFVSDLTLSGQDAGNKLTLISTSPGTQYTLDLESGHEAFSFLNVRDSNLQTSTILPTSSTNSGNNSDLWLFSIRIAGHISSGASGLAGVSVNAGALGNTTTDAQGDYVLSDVPYASAYTLSASKTGYTLAPLSVTGTITNHVTANFAATLNTYSISGTITDGSNPVPGVSISAGGIGSTLTASDGTYSFASVPHGTTYTLTPSKTGYTFAPTSTSSTLTSAATHNFTATLNTYSISGTVTDGSNPYQE